MFSALRRNTSEYIRQNIYVRIRTDDVQALYHADLEFKRHLSLAERVSHLPSERVPATEPHTPVTITSAPATNTQDYFTNKVYSVVKSGSPHDVTQGNLLRPSE